ncbi:unnamed protein product [Tetraodon nigroviridis]|uniref:(spotted green pufferfish) hypothetical protein n=1 Tax=Tetraodon nigroviridis TaxID=99883 RepID=Q4T5T7_TETNG|nr:unnamed protein product [Tetraodon nigroviridis]
MLPSTPATTPSTGIPSPSPGPGGHVQGAAAAGGRGGVCGQEDGQELPMSGGAADQRAAGAGLCGDRGTGDAPAGPKGGRSAHPGHPGPAGEESLLRWTWSQTQARTCRPFLLHILCGHAEDSLPGTAASGGTRSRVPVPCTCPSS